MRIPGGSYFAGCAEHFGEQILPCASSCPGSVMIHQLQGTLTAARTGEGAVTECRAMQTETENPVKKGEGTLSSGSPIGKITTALPFSLIPWHPMTSFFFQPFVGC